jgi:uncharacterized protein DUF3168
MIEQGFVQLVQSASAVNTIAATGGFLAELPKDQVLPSWSFTTVADSADYVLAGPVDLGSWNVQIDCYANTREQAVLLAAAIDAVLNGYAGTLADPDHTVVQGIFQIDKRDFFDDARRTYRRMLEYEVWSNG